MTNRKLTHNPVEKSLTISSTAQGILFGDSVSVRGLPLVLVKTQTEHYLKNFSKTLLVFYFSRGTLSDYDDQKS